MQMLIYGKRKTSQVEITHQVLDRIEANTVLTPAGCLTWTKAKTPDGYGGDQAGRSYCLRPPGHIHRLHWPHP